MRREPAVFLRFGTRPERTASESAAGLRTPLFTARYRHYPDTPRYIQHHDDRPQPAADDKG